VRKIVTTNKEVTTCANCGRVLEIGEGRGVNSIDCPEEQKDFLCPNCWNRIGDWNYSEYEQ